MPGKSYPLGFHFDPIIFHQGWEKGYQETIGSLFKKIDSKGIVWISLGGFRYPPQLKAIAKERFPDTKIFLGELFPGRDGKFRYLKEIRVEMYQKLVGWLRDVNPNFFVYLWYGKQRGMGKSFRLGTIKQSPFESVV